MPPTHAARGDRPHKREPRTKRTLHNRLLTPYEDQQFVLDGYPEKRQVPVVDLDQALVMMAAHADKDPGVFWDRGWGDDGELPMISIILDGDGQNPIGFITRDTYDLLLEDKRIGPNGLHTFKARRWHAFAGEGASPAPVALAGCACRVCRGTASATYPRDGV